MKQKKKIKKLAARIAAWESLSPSVKGKENGFTKPGSFNK